MKNGVPFSPGSSSVFAETEKRSVRGDKVERGLRVATQYWKGDARVCELEGTGQVLDIHISGPANGSWIAAAHSSHGEEAVVISGSGGSPSAALLEVAQTWTRSGPELGLQAFDWKAVADVLRTVKAID